MINPDATVDEHVRILIAKCEVELLVECLNIAVFFVHDSNKDAKTLNDFKLLKSSIINQLRGYENNINKQG